MTFPQAWNVSLTKQIMKIKNETLFVIEDSKAVDIHAII